MGPPKFGGYALLLRGATIIGPRPAIDLLPRPGNKVYSLRVSLGRTGFEGRELAVSRGGGPPSHAGRLPRRDSFEPRPSPRAAPESPVFTPASNGNEIGRKESGGSHFLVIRISKSGSKGDKSAAGGRPRSESAPKLVGANRALLHSPSPRTLHWKTQQPQPPSDARHLTAALL